MFICWFFAELAVDQEEDDHGELVWVHMLPQQGPGLRQILQGGLVGHSDGSLRGITYI